MDFFKTPKLLKFLYPGLVWDSRKFTGDQPVIYLTFDDGPDPEVTPWVLETLAEYGAKATFFCVGNNVRKYPEVCDKTVAQGHSIGNHTYSHLDGWKSTIHEYLDNIALADIYFNQIDRNTGLFRPPYGKITRKQIRYLSPFYKIIMWDILTGDYNSAFDKDKCLTKTINHTRPGSIVIFHDSLKAEKNLKYVLPRYLQKMYENGYQFHRLN